MDKVRNTTHKEECKMATLTSFRQSTVIQRSKTHDFLRAFNESRVDKKYWDECKKSNQAISTSAMDTLKKICSGKTNE